MAGMIGKFPLIHTKMQRLALLTSDAVDHESIRKGQRHPRAEPRLAHAARLPGSLAARRVAGWTLVLTSDFVPTSLVDVARMR